MTELFVKSYEKEYIFIEKNTQLVKNISNRWFHVPDSISKRNRYYIRGSMELAYYFFTVEQKTQLLKL